MSSWTDDQIADYYAQLDQQALVAGLPTAGLVQRQAGAQMSVNASYSSSSPEATIARQHSYMLTKGARLVGAAVRSLPPALVQSAISAIATLVGAGVDELITRYLKKKSRGPSRRGITGRQLAITQRTIGKVENMHRRLAAAFGRAHSGRSSRRPPFRVMAGGKR